jgi:hypothetical protein
LIRGLLFAGVTPNFAAAQALPNRSSSAIISTIQVFALQPNRAFRLEMFSRRVTMQRRRFGQFRSNPTGEEALQTLLFSLALQ